ncbi:MAG: NAD+ synthase [Synergistetes bacterium]|nr:NAD+ synthase [Synergistota bacterium]MCX8127200.1 NAD+ synthase [Synergistota bacterium]MDW8191914.1 NAD+ synthase [Synergistota bacterium]
MFDAAEFVERAVSWIRDEIGEAGAKGGVVGISGGVDSAVVALLLKRAMGENMLGLIMPCRSVSSDLSDALEFVKAFEIPYRLVDLSSIYEAFLNILGEVDKRGDIALANIKPRLRMITLYYFANRLNYLVVGTGNRSELEVGYFTKYGDGGVDILPIGSLVKSEVREVARHLGVPEKIIHKPPTAGLWDGQTDEGEMGITYEVLDKYLLEGKADPDIVRKIEGMRKRSDHKRMPPKVLLFKK